MELKDVELNYIEKWLPEASVKYKDGSPLGREIRNRPDIHRMKRNIFLSFL
ncbi:hypothetical protein LZ633_19425 [Enterobacter asburiae]|nr:hypothetical protein [Enterobacter asburiae]